MKVADMYEQASLKNTYKFQNRFYLNAKRNGICFFGVAQTKIPILKREIIFKHELNKRIISLISLTARTAFLAGEFFR